MAFGRISTELNRDNQIFFNLMLVFLCLFLGSWSLWFFKMHVKIYLDSETAIVTENHRIEASYPLEYFNRFKVGQIGNFYLDKHRWPEFQPFEARVENVSVNHSEQRALLYLAIEDAGVFQSLPQLLNKKQK